MSAAHGSPSDQATVDQLLELLEEFRQAAARSKQTMLEMSTRIEQQDQMLIEQTRTIATLRTQLALATSRTVPQHAE